MIDPLDAVASVGRGTIGVLRRTGAVALFGGEGVSHWVRPPFYARIFWLVFVEFAFFSLPVVALTAVFSGMVIALQSYSGFARFNASSATASVVVLSVVRELGPVLAGLMVAGRMGAAMAAELGTMRVTDQVDALATLSTNPVKYLVAPRLLAGLIALPLLVVVADVLGVGGGFLVSVVKLGFAPRAYLQSTLDILQMQDVVAGVGEGVRVRVHRVVDGVLSRVSQPGGCAGGGGGDDGGCRVGEHPDPGVRLCAD